MKSSRKLLSYILVLLSVLALSSCHSNKNVSHTDYHQGKTSGSGVDYGSDSGSEGWNFYSNQIINEAKTWLGTPYKYGGSAKKKGTDCSGMTQQVYLTVTGVEIPRNSARQSEYCKKVSNKKVLPGDLVFFNTSGKGVSHVGIYLGNSNMIHASGSQGVMISSLNDQYWQKAYLCCGRVPQMEILAQNYTPAQEKVNKKERGNKKEKTKKKSEKNQKEDPIYTPAIDAPITSGVMESDYAHNEKTSGPSPDDYASNHYATNWNETVENSTYTTDYVAKARFKKQPTLPIVVPTTPVQTEVASNDTEPVKVSKPATTQASTATTAPTTEFASATTVNNTASQATTASTNKLTPPSQHSEVFSNYDQYGGTTINTHPALTDNTKKDETEKLYEEAVSTRHENNVEISSVASTANVPSDKQQKKAISPAEAFGKRNTSTSTSTTSNVTPTVPATKVTTTPITHINDDEEEENPWMD